MAGSVTPHGTRYAAHCFDHTDAQQRGPALMPAEKSWELRDVLNWGGEDCNSRPN